MVESIELKAESGRKLALGCMVYSGNDYANWVKNLDADKIKAVYEKEGILLIRNSKNGENDYDHSELIKELSDKVCDDLLGKQFGRRTIRRKLAKDVFSSTEASKKSHILLHSENTYNSYFPSTVIFHKVTVADKGGRTPIAKLSEILEDIPDSVYDRVMKNGVKYVRKTGVLPGQDWRTVYDTDDREELTKHLQEIDCKVDWLEDNILSVETSLPGVATHPTDKSRVWLNHLYTSNSRTLKPQVREMLIKQFGETNLPTESYFGDGTALTDEEFTALDKAHTQNAYEFDWQEGDILIVDNMKFAHGRRPYEGERKLLVTLGNPVTWEQVKAL